MPLEDQTADSHSAPPGVLYGTAESALKAVQDDYIYWTARLTDSSFQLSLALVGANWAVHGTVRAVLGSFWSKISILLVVIGLLVTLVGAKLMGEMHRRRVDYAEANPERWKAEFLQSSVGVNPWPFTREILDLGLFLRHAKLWLPIASGAAFVLALVYS